MDNKFKTLVKDYVTVDTDKLLMFCLKSGFGGAISSDNDGKYTVRFGYSGGSPEFIVSNLDDDGVVNLLTRLLKVYADFQILLDDLKPRVIYW